MPGMYRFTFDGAKVLTVEEYENGVWQVEDIKKNAVWTYDSVNNVVTKTETEKGKTKTKTFTDANQDGIFIASSGGDSQTPSAKPHGKLYDISIENGVVTAVSENHHGTWQAETLSDSEQWSYDAVTDTVTRTETENGYTETTTYARTADGYFVRIAENYVLNDGKTALHSQTDDSYFGKSDDAGDSYDDNILASGNDDYIESYGGKDYIQAGNGNDYINSGDGDDKAFGGNGNDLFIGDDAGNDLYDGGNGIDTVNYSATQSSVQVNLSKSSASGSSIGKDTLKNIEHVLAGSGDDQIQGGKQNNSLYGGAGDDSMDGAEGDDTLFGDTGDDLLNGGKGNDALSGGEGNDILNGGLGRDILTGGAGNDLFVFNTKLDAKFVDRITDFSHGEDTIQLDDAVYTKLKGITDLSTHLVNGSAAIDSDDFLIYNSENGKLMYDSNGAAKGGLVTIAVLTTGLTLDSADFSII